jgi:adenylate cyclase
VAVIPVLPPNVGADFVRNRGRINIGEERYAVSMFIDMRGSTKLSQARLPFDTVFLINRFVEAASQAVTGAGGQPNQFVGDGVLALFGLDCDAPTACRQALRAAAAVASNVAYLNHQFASEVQEPIQYGIGIHAGEVIVGDIGFRGHTVFTALGDSVNVASRSLFPTRSVRRRACLPMRLRARMSRSEDTTGQWRCGLPSTRPFWRVCSIRSLNPPNPIHKPSPQNRTRR